MKRRDFVLAGASLAASVALPRGVFAGGLGADAQGLRARYAACLGSEFQVFGSNGATWVLKLTELDAGSACHGTDQFSLLWEGPGTNASRAGCYRMLHPVLGERVLYLEPGFAAAGRTRMRAQFSLLT